MWSTVGVDRVRGGFFEKIDLRGLPVEAPRRSRVVARQIYVFATAAEHGWSAQAQGLVEHGLQFLSTKLRQPDGTYASSIDPDGALIDARFDLYEQAFVLFALAAAWHSCPHRRNVLSADAWSLVRAVRQRWSHPRHGFEESDPRSLPLKSNPHMHLLEAALAWSEIGDGEQPAWNALADELATLCTTRFIDPESGALREYFDGDWRPMPDERGAVIEPGHQFEWSWLLARWGRARGSDAALRMASRLRTIGEDRGVDARRNVAVDQLDERLSVTVETAKLWPQTERVKAWDLARRMPSDDGEAIAARHTLEKAVDGMSQYFLPSPAGLWHEQMQADGQFALQDCRASSLYHIVCAIDTLVKVDAPEEPTTSR